MREKTEEDVSNWCGSFSKTKDQDKLSFSNMIDDIIYEMEDREEWFALQSEPPALAGKSCNLLWFPTIGGPGYIQIIHAEVW